MMAIYKSGWLRVPNDPENFKERFAWSHVKTVFYDKVKNILLKDKLDDMDGLIADHADAIANKLMTNDAFNTAIADYVTKAMMSSTQVNDANHVPTSSLAYAMQQAITANANAITQLNSDIKIKFYGKVTDLSVIKTLCQQDYECWVGYIDWKNTEILPSTGGTMLWFAFDWIVCGLCYGKMFYLNMDTLTWS